MTINALLTAQSRTQRLRGIDPTIVVLPAALVLMILAFGLASPTFFSVANVFVIMRQTAVLGVAAIGGTMILIAGRLDISQGAIIAAAGILCVSLMQAGLAASVAMLASIALGVLLGLVNGLLTEGLKIPGFIATLATALVIRGAALLFTGGQSTAAPIVEGFDLLAWVGTGSIGPMPVSVILLITLYVVAWFIMHKTAWGLRVYAIGSSAKAARTAGIRVRAQAVQIFVVAGALSALAGVLLAGRLGSGAPSNGTGAEFDIFAAVVLGGASLYGGKGSVMRTLLGIVFLASLSNGLVILNVSSYVQGIATGLVLLLALAIDRVRTKDND